MDLEYIDGNPVVSHVVRFKDRTTISETDALAVRDGQVVVWVVRTVCQPPSYHPTHKGSDDRYRFNIQEVKAAAVLHGELREGALAYLDDPSQTQGRFVFDHPTYSSDDPGPVDIDTRELAYVDTGTAWPPAPLPDLPESAYPPGAVPLDVDVLEDDDDDGSHIVGSVYSAAGSDVHRLLDKWDEL